MKEKCTHCNKTVDLTEPVIVFWYTSCGGFLRNGGYLPKTYSLCKNCLQSLYNSVKDYESEVKNV